MTLASSYFHILAEQGKKITRRPSQNRMFAQGFPVVDVSWESLLLFSGWDRIVTVLEKKVCVYVYTFGVNPLKGYVIELGTRESLSNKWTNNPQK